MPPHALLSSERMDWRTPREFLDLVRAVRPILIDPCTSPENPAGAQLFAARGIGPNTTASGTCIAGDGLAYAWHLLALEARRHGLEGLAFWNPPYGAHLSGPIEPDRRIMRRPEKGAEPVCVGVGRGWAEKFAQEARAGLESIALVPVRTDSEWWHVMLDASVAAGGRALLWRSPTLGARIAFVHPDTGRPVQGSNLASTVFYAGPDAEKFVRTFGPHGRIIR